jgi:hypothetical protein
VLDPFEPDELTMLQRVFDQTCTVRGFQKQTPEAVEVAIAVPLDGGFGRLELAAIRVSASLIKPELDRANVSADMFQFNRCLRAAGAALRLCPEPTAPWKAPRLSRAEPSSSECVNGLSSPVNCMGGDGWG